MLCWCYLGGKGVGPNNGLLPGSFTLTPCLKPETLMMPTNTRSIALQTALEEFSTVVPVVVPVGFYDFCEIFSIVETSAEDEKMRTGWPTRRACRAGSCPCPAFATVRTVSEASITVTYRKGSSQIVWQTEASPVQILLTKYYVILVNYMTFLRNFWKLKTKHVPRPIIQLVTMLDFEAFV